MDKYFAHEQVQLEIDAAPQAGEIELDPYVSCFAEADDLALFCNGQNDRAIQ